MREADAQLVLLVAAVEECDGTGALLSAPQRAAATEAGRGHAGGGDLDALRVARARRLLVPLEAEVPRLASLLALARVGRGSVPVVAVLAALLGLSLDALGRGGVIQILSAPLLGLVAWNLAVCATLGLAALLRRRESRTQGEASLPAAATPQRSIGPGAARDGGRPAPRGLLAGLLQSLLERALTRAAARQVRHQALLAGALLRWAARWRVVASELIAARLALLLHAGALALVAGAVAGMYLRGLLLQYRATWESTFLDAAAVDRVLAVVLGPAAALLGRELPPVAPFEHPASDDAAAWIHLYAVTAALFVLVPRGLLACATARRVRRFAADLCVPADGAELLRLRPGLSGLAARVDVLPCSVELAPAAASRLREALHETFGTRAEVVLHGALPWGEDPPELPASERRPRLQVLLFALAATPEAEVQGRAASACAARADGQVLRLLVLVDASAFAASVGRDSPRLAERRRAWDRVLREAGVPAAHVDLAAGQLATDALLAALHPPLAGSR